ncbi:Glycoside Hydrolase Family 15 protein [Trametes cinnabarina]|uniref:Glycoside Hydrolase Family 15 protein n=1 Tax=Pycnoporus cinnabarinus TaxID=5643 RepID=A0A060SD53_PYCCI|nr:Glycoside Hydrolase Family 15 protein [Trametes cinnabarina]
MMNVTHPEKDRGYIPIADHGLIGNLRTAALISTDGSVESYCVPNFDSPSIFARILDKDKGGHFSITPTIPFTTKQSYLPNSNILQTKYLNEQGVVTITDFLPRQPTSAKTRPLLAWLIRRVEVIRGSMPLRVECAPAFNYARSSHTTEILLDTSVAVSYSPVPRDPHNKALFTSVEANLNLDLRYTAESTLENVAEPVVKLNLLDLKAQGHRGPGVWSHLDLKEGQIVTFVLRTPPDVKLPPQAQPSREAAQELGIPYEKLVAGASTLRPHDDPILTRASGSHLTMCLLQYAHPFRRRCCHTNTYWNAWIACSTYTGSWKEAVTRSALALKLLIYEPTGAVVASPTFSLPEYLGGTRNWDYRASWIRDSSFTLYALIRLGFTHEANAYMEFIFERCSVLLIGTILRYTIHVECTGEKEFPEVELTHLDGHKGSKPVRIGNGAIDHVQLYQRELKPFERDTIHGSLSGTSWNVGTVLLLSPSASIHLVSQPPDVIAHAKDPDLVAIDRGRTLSAMHSRAIHLEPLGIRLTEKRSLPCPRRNEWYAARDALYEEIMQKAWNKEKRFFAQSYEDLDILDSALLIMPLVFFSTPVDPRFLSTLRQILLSPERGGLTSNGLVYRYDVKKTDDGVGGEEGTFCLCTLWCVEALARAGEYDKAMLERAVGMFEDFLQYTNHLGLCTEEISDAGEALGNAVQGFTVQPITHALEDFGNVLKSGRSEICLSLAQPFGTPMYTPVDPATIPVIFLQTECLY